MWKVHCYKQILPLEAWFCFQLYLILNTYYFNEFLKIKKKQGVNIISIFITTWILHSYKRTLTLDAQLQFSFQSCFDFEHLLFLFQKYNKRVNTISIFIPMWKLHSFKRILPLCIRDLNLKEQKIHVMSLSHWIG